MMMATATALPSFDVAQVRSLHPFPEFFLRRGLPLKRTSNGRYFTCKCPLHHEQNGESFVVDPENHTWSCFGKCQAARRDVISYVQLERGLSFPEACAELLREGNGSCGTHLAPPSPKPQAPAPVTITWPLTPSADDAPPTWMHTLAEKRGYPLMLLQRLHDAEQIDYDARGNAIAFPVRDEEEESPRALHLFPQTPRPGESKARYLGTASPVPPYVWGDPATAQKLYVCESQWDLLAVLCAWPGAGMAWPEGVAFLATRGASLGANIQPHLRADGAQTVCLVMQNDEPDDQGRRAAEAWAALVDGVLPPGARSYRLYPPAEHEDAQAWLKAVGVERFQEEFHLADKHGTSQTAGTEVEVHESPPSHESHEAAVEAAAFPLSALPDPAREICEGLRRIMPMPEALCGCTALGILSAAIGPGLRIISTPQGETTGANLYLVAAAGVSSGKSTCYRHLAEPFLSRNQELHQTWLNQTESRIGARRLRLEADLKRIQRSLNRGKADEEELEQLRTLRKELDALERMRPPRLFVNNATPESIVQRMAEQDHQCLTSLTDEAREVIDILQGKYSTGAQMDDAFYVSAWTGGQYAYDRCKNPNGLLLTRPWLSLLWLVQPDKLAEVVTGRALFESGFFQRLLICDTGARPLCASRDEHAIPDVARRAWAESIGALLDAYRLRDGEESGVEPMVITAEPAAREYLWDYADEVVRRQQGELADLPTAAGKWAENAWRLALVLHAGDRGDEAHRVRLPLHCAERAVRLMRWFAAESLRLLAPRREEKGRKRAEQLRLILEAPNYPRREGATRGQLKDRHEFGEAELRDLCARYPVWFELLEKPAGESGRKTFRVRLAERRGA